MPTDRRAGTDGEYTRFARRRALWSLLGFAAVIVVCVVGRNWFLLYGWIAHRLWMWEFDEPKIEWRKR